MTEAQKKDQDGMGWDGMGVLAARGVTLFLAYTSHFTLACHGMTQCLHTQSFIERLPFVWTLFVRCCAALESFFAAPVRCCSVHVLPFRSPALPLCSAALPERSSASPLSGAVLPLSSSALPLCSAVSLLSSPQGRMAQAHVTPSPIV